MKVVLVVKNPLANTGDRRDEAWFLGWEDPLEQEMATTPVFLPGESHGGLQSIGLQGVRQDSKDLAFIG